MGRPKDTPAQKVAKALKRRDERPATVKDMMLMLPPERKCKAFTTGLHGEKRPCKKWAIRGGTVCPTHGGSAPQVKKAAQKRLNAMCEPAIIRLNDLMQQSEHLPTSLGAAVTILKHTIGNEGAKQEDTTVRPTLNIGIVIGGMPSVTVTETKPASKQLATPDDVTDGEAFEVDEDGED